MDLSSQIKSIMHNIDVVVDHWSHDLHQGPLPHIFSLSLITSSHYTIEVPQFDSLMETIGEQTMCLAKKGKNQ